MKHLLTKTFGSTSIAPPRSDLLSNIIKVYGLGHEASHYYNMISNRAHKGTSALKLVWEIDLNTSITDKEWDKICQNIKKTSRDIKIRLIQFKILNRFYWTPSRLHRIGIKDTANCWRCERAEGTLLHAVWSCSAIQHYWLQVHKIILDITKSNIAFNPRLYVLGDPKCLDKCTRMDAEWIQTSIMVGKQIIMRGWKTLGGPPVQEWLTELGKVAAYERLSYGMQNRPEAFQMKWGKYLSYIERG